MSTKELQQIFNDREITGLQYLDYLSFTVGQLPGSTGAVPGETIGAYWKEEGLFQYLEWDGTEWQEKGAPISTKGYVDDKASLSKQETKDEIGIQDDGLEKNLRGNGHGIRELRQPILICEDEFPSNNSPFRIHWRDGDTLYAVANDRRLLKSTDAGSTWEHKQAHTASGVLILDGNPFLITSNGTIILYTATGGAVRRSTDDGETFEDVLTMTGGPMGSQGIAEDYVTGYIYATEYRTGDELEFSVYRSTDSGATWTKWYSWDTENATTKQHEYTARHCHSAQWDPVSQRMYILVGDNEAEAGLYRVSADNSTLEPVLLNNQTIDGINARAIGMMFFENYIAWGTDGTAYPFICRMHRDQIGVQDPVMEKIYECNGTMWFTQKASNDGSKWVISASSEGSSSIDEAVHLYYVENEGVDVYEVGAFREEAESGLRAISAAGMPEISGGDVFYLKTHFGRPQWSGRFKIARGAYPFSLGKKADRIIAWQTFSAAGIELTPLEEYDFGRYQLGAKSTLVVHDIGSFCSTNRSRIEIVNTSTGTVLFEWENMWNYTYPSSEATPPSDKFHIPENLSFNLSPGERVAFRLVNRHGTESGTSHGFVTFAVR